MAILLRRCLPVLAITMLILLSWQVTLSRSITGILRFELFHTNSSISALTSKKPSKIFTDMLIRLVKPDKILHSRGIVYDFYSLNDAIDQKLGSQWLSHPVPNEMKLSNHLDKFWWPPDMKNSTRPAQILILSPLTKTNLSFIDEIHVVSDISFTDRHNHLKFVFERHGIPTDSIQWWFKWDRKTCGMPENLEYIRKRLNMNPAKKIRTNLCPVIMKHIDIWYDLASRPARIALILEDDPLFVPFFKEKLNRMIYTAIRTGALRVNGQCLELKQNETMQHNEWTRQEPMFVIGTCFDFHDTNFQANNSQAMPILTTQKSRVSRCAHAYIITGCTARAMVYELENRLTEYDTPDFWMNGAFSSSNILQSFWIDPPLVYQGNRVQHDLDQVQTFKETKYH